MTSSAKKYEIENIPLLAGSLVKPKEYFGEQSRFSIAPVYTRFDSVEWFVWDKFHSLSTGDIHEVIIQEASQEEAMNKLVKYIQKLKDRSMSFIYGFLAYKNGIKSVYKDSNILDMIKQDICTEEHSWSIMKSWTAGWIQASKLEKTK